MGNWSWPFLRNLVGIPPKHRLVSVDVHCRWFGKFEFPFFGGKDGHGKSKNNYYRAAAVLVADTEAYGNQKQGLNLSLTLEIINQKKSVCILKGSTCSSTNAYR